MNKFNIYLENGKKITLSENDLSNSGGEGKIFIKDNFAYKIFHDKNKSIEKEKVKELSILSRDNIIRPLQTILNENNEIIGYQMNAVYPNECFPLTRFFTNDFRQQHNIDDDIVSNIIKEMYQTFEFVHEKGFLIVDGNEMNFLISNDFKKIYFIDVDSYKTPSFNPTAYNPNTLDPILKNNNFNKGSDWYIFGILFCQILLGIHPFKGKYVGTSKTFGKNDIAKRMLDGVSIFNKNVKLNKAVRDISIIPSKMRIWLEDIFTSDVRNKPPLLDNVINYIGHKVDIFNISKDFKVYETLSFNQNIDNFIKMGKSYIYQKEKYYYSEDNERLSKIENLPFLINGNIAFAKNTINGLEIYIPSLKIKTKVKEAVDNIYVFDNQLYIYNNNKISSVDLFVTNNNIVMGINNTWDLFHHQNVNEFMLFYQSGKRKAYYFYENEKNAVIDFDNIIDKNEKIINIKGFENYIVLKTLINNEYHCNILYLDYFSKKLTSIYQSLCFDSSINFLLNNNLIIGECSDEELIIGYYKDKNFKMKIVKDFILNKNLFVYDNKISFIDKDKLYNLTMN